MTARPLLLLQTWTLLLLLSVQNMFLIPDPLFTSPPLPWILLVFLSPIILGEWVSLSLLIFLKQLFLMVRNTVLVHVLPQSPPLPLILLMFQSLFQILIIVITAQLFLPLLILLLLSFLSARNIFSIQAILLGLPMLLFLIIIMRLLLMKMMEIAVMGQFQSLKPVVFGHFQPLRPRPLLIQLLILPNSTAIWLIQVIPVPLMFTFNGD